MTDRPKITDNDSHQIEITVAGESKQVWVYSDEADRREKMRQAHYWCDGFMCASGAALKQVADETSI